MAQTAETLTKNELLLSPIFNGFGLTDRMSVFTAPLALAFGATQMIVKYKAYETEDFKFSPTLGHAIILGEGTASGIGGYLDVQSNSKFISHTSFMVFRSSLVGNKRTGGAVTETTLGSVLRSQYEYILDSWDRLIFGPAYYFDTKTVGGNLSYLMVWDHFHFGFGLFTKSITELSWSDNGYSPTVTLFWRI